MTAAGSLTIALVACALALATLPASDDGVATPGPQDPAPLRAGVDLVTIDVQIVPATGVADVALPDPRPEDFVVKVNGESRPVVSAVRLHDDEGSVMRRPGPAVPDREDAPGCVFGFHRTTDRRTRHYVIGIARTDADRRRVPQVRVSASNGTFTVAWYLWRSPIRR
ncbi:MAG: hypothetical protein R2752_04365 [Vicinamibacterales bacterium]